MRAIAMLTAACLLAGCASTPVPSAAVADATRCDALAGTGWQRIAAPEVAADLLTLAHVTTAPHLAQWYLAGDGAHAACLPPDAGAVCGHVLHTFQPQVHRMWGWSESTARRETCAVD